MPQCAECGHTPHLMDACEGRIWRGLRRCNCLSSMIFELMMGRGWPLRPIPTPTTRSIWAHPPVAGGSLTISITPFTADGRGSIKITHTPPEPTSEPTIET